MVWPMTALRTTTSPDGGGLQLLPALALAFISLIAVAVVALRPGAPGTPVAVFFSPYADADSALRRVAAAGGEILRPGAAASIVIARSDDPAFVARLYDHGALLVASGLAAWACAAGANGAS